MISDRQEKEREIRKDQILESALKVFKINKERTLKKNGTPNRRFKINREKSKKRD